MILHLVKCEACEKTHPFDPMVAPAYTQMPATWLILVDGKTQEHEGYNFCSKECLFDWMCDRWQIGGGFKPEMPAFVFHSSETRRFLLVEDKPNADFVEGVQFGNGSVVVASSDPRSHDVFYSWESFKDMHRVEKVHWIDQEAKTP